MKKMRDSILYDNVIKIFIVLIGEIETGWYDDPKIEVIYRGKLGEYESETINRINVSDDCPVLYLHSKGVTKPHIKQINDWNELFFYYLIEEWRLCVECLKTYDTVSVNLHSKPIPNYKGNYVHYSGNMWWTTGKHLKQLGKLKMINYLDSEMYICKQGKHLCVWDSTVNHYFDYYSRENYCGKVNAYCITN
jgi:hypothetical protein